jgi:hypothetical protein
MDSSKTAIGSRAGNPRNRVTPTSHLPQKVIRRVHGVRLPRQSIEEFEWQPEPANLRAELRTVRSIPGDDRVKLRKCRNSMWRRFDIGQAHQVESRR